MRDEDDQVQKHPGHIEVARQGNSVLLCVIGLGNMNIALTMLDFIRQAADSGQRNFALDLARCEGMDSTFMGTIVSALQEVEEYRGGLCLLNVSPENRRLLEMIGVARLVTCKDGFSVESVETECLLPVLDPARRMRLIRDAHANLLAVDRRNQERFGRFLQRLEQEMGWAQDDRPGGGAARPASDEAVTGEGDGG